MKRISLLTGVVLFALITPAFADDDEVLLPDRDGTSDPTPGPDTSKIGSAVIGGKYSGGPTGDDQQNGVGDGTGGYDNPCDCMPGTDGIDWNGDGVSDSNDIPYADPGLYHPSNGHSGGSNEGSGNRQAETGHGSGDGGRGSD